jgi:hypothetical protein
MVLAVWKKALAACAMLVSTSSGQAQSPQTDATPKSGSGATNSAPPTAIVTGLAAPAQREELPPPRAENKPPPGPPQPPAIMVPSPSCLSKEELECLKKRRKYGFPDQFIALPLGHSVYEHFGIQVRNGVIGRMIFNHYDFIGDTDQLNQRGRDKLCEIAALAARYEGGILIERTTLTPQLDEARRKLVAKELAEIGGAGLAARVVVGRPSTLGLQGKEIELIQGNFLYQTRNGGVSATGAGGSPAGGAAGQGAGATGTGAVSPGGTIP